MLLLGAPPWRAPLLIRKPTIPNASPSPPIQATEAAAGGDGLTCRQIERSKPPSRAAALSPPTQAREARAGVDIAACGQIEKSRPSLRSASMSMVVALQSPGSRRSVAPYRLCAPLPPIILPHLRASLLRSISLHCYLMARSAVLCADTRRMRAAPLPRSLPLPNCLFPASPCRRETAKGAA